MSMSMSMSMSTSLLYSTVLPIDLRRTFAAQ